MSWDEYCLICGCGIENRFRKGEEIFDSTAENETYIVPKTIKEYNWQNSLYLITSEEKLISATSKSYEAYGELTINNKVYTITPINYHNDKLNQYIKNRVGYGIVVHRDCYHVIEKKLHYKLYFADVCTQLAKTNCLLKDLSLYGEMKKYTAQQVFDAIGAFHDAPWLLESPIVNTKNKLRILKTWTGLIKKLKPPKDCPCEPAKLFKVGKTLKGFDGKQWIVVKQQGVLKWTPV